MKTAMKYLSFKMHDCMNYNIDVTPVCGNIASVDLFSGRPGAPLGPLIVENVDANTLTLSWLPPKHIGNGPLTGFFIEKMLAGSWVVASELPPDTTTCHLDKLIGGAKYRFRVSAQNEYGKSDYLTTSDMIETRTLTGKKIMRD